MIRMLPSIETERLMLKQLQIEDAAQVQALASDYEIYKTTLSVPHPYTLEMAEKWIVTHESAVEEDHMYQWGIYEKQKNLLVGIFSIGLVLSKNMGEVGYWIGQRYWHSGYASEATKAVIDYGFSELHLNRVYGRYLAINPASRRVMEKAGMLYEGTLQDAIIKDGTYHAVGYLGVSRATWLRQNNRASLRLSVRKAQVQDASALSYIQSSAFQEDIERYGERPDCPAYESLERLQHKIENGTYYVIEENGRLIGGAHLRNVNDDTLRLARIYLDPAYHNLGIGRFFIRELEKRHAETTVWSLDTPYKNYRNHHFYESLGYVKVGENKLDEDLILFDYQKCRQEMNHGTAE